MAIIITNETSTIKFDLGNNEEHHLDKENLSIKKKFGFVYVYGSSDDTVKFTKLKIKYTDVTSPVVASNTELIATLLGYKSSTATVVGDVRITDGVEFASVTVDGKLETTAELSPVPGSELGNVGIVDDAGNRQDLKENAHTSKVECLVNMEGHVCTNNSTSDNLAGDAIFPGAWEDTIDFGTIIVGVKTDKDSAVDGLKIEWSSDGITAHDSDSFSILQDRGKVFTFQPARRYFKVSYTNGSSPTTSLNIETTLRRYHIKPSSHRIQDNIVAEDDAELGKSVITGQDPKGIFQNVQVSDNGNFKVNLAEFGDTPSIDAFGRLRISEPFTLFDSKQLHDKQPLFWDEIIGGVGTSVHSATDASVRMAVTASANDYVIRQTKQKFNYQPGKSQLAFITFHAPQSGDAVKRIGLFDGTGVDYLTPNNGVFFEIDGTISWNIAKNGTTTETVGQANWNVDKLNGSGPSGKTLDLDATQIIVIDYEWLGVGRVRVGFVIDGLVYYVHYFNHANDATFSSVYMSSPNLPIRYDIQADGTGVDHMDHICSTVMSEGGLEETGILRSVNTGTTHIDADIANTAYAIIGLRLKAAYHDITLLPQSLSVMDEQGNDFKWELCLNPTISGTFTYADEANSAIQSANGATANVVTNLGIVMSSGYVPSGNKAGAAAGADIKTALRIGGTIAGVQDQLVLVVTPLAAGSDIHASMTIRELL